jgi:hypothetical protein
MVAKERGRAGHPDESIQAAGVRKKMLTDLLQGNMTPAENGHVLHVAQGNWSVTKKVRSERNECGHSQRSDDLTAICKRDRMPGQRETVLGIVADNLSKACWSWAMSQPLIPRGANNLDC